jgi:hypothetical protein
MVMEFLQNNISPGRSVKGNVLEISDMAMTTCKECGGLISTSAIACPTCGIKTKKRVPYSTAEKLTLLAIVVFVAIAIFEQVFRG